MHLPYMGKLHDSKYLFVVPGQPPVCFRFEEVGHLRQECPAYRYGGTGGRSYASAVRTPTAVSKPGKKEMPLAVDKPEEKALGRADEELLSYKRRKWRESCPPVTPPSDQEEPVLSSSSDGQGGGTEATSQIEQSSIERTLHLEEEGYLEVKRKKTRRTQMDLTESLSRPGPIVKPHASQ